MLCCSTAAGQKRTFNFNKFGQRSVVLHLMYVGWDYQGFARQADIDNTIEVGCGSGRQCFLFSFAYGDTCIPIQLFVKGW